jgi:hypothetical protein
MSGGQINAKKPKAGGRVSGQKRPKSLVEQIPPERQTIVWSLSSIDNDCDWPCKQIDANTFWNLIFPRIKAFESMTWDEARGRGEHYVAISKLIKPAQNRLIEIGLDDLDRLYRLSIKGLQRIWGFRRGNAFCVLWYDPNHCVCPSRKKNR